MSKIGLMCIFKDDSEFDVVERMLSSFMPFMDGLVVGLTGPSGKFSKLKKLIKKYNGTIIECSPQTHPDIYHNGKFASFSSARNVVLNLAEQMDFDWLSWADCDDVLVGGEHLHTIAERADKQKMDAVFFTYWYSVKVKSDGTYSDKDVEIDQVRERLIKPGKFYWKSRLHEIAIAKDNYKPKITDWKYDPKGKENVVWVHLTSHERADSALQRNLEILNIQVEEEEGKDPRTILYLARTYYDLNTREYDQKAIPLIEKYLELSGWQEERAIAWECMGDIYARSGDHPKAIDCFLSATNEFPNRHKNYLNLAKEYFDLQRYDYAEFWVDVALRMDKPEARTVVGNPLEIMYMAAAIKYNLALKKMKLKDAINWRKTMNEIAHVEDDGMLKVLEDADYQNQIAMAIFNTARYLNTKGYKDKLASLVNAIPSEFAGEPFVASIMNEMLPPKTWPSKSIVYYASWGQAHFETWDETNLKKGIGGSETAVIQLTKEWAKAGYDVTVYSDCEAHVSADGVKYLPYWQINWRDQFYTLILWRSPHLLDLDIKAYHLYMDLHDIASQIDFTEARMEKLDKVFFKSPWHRSQVPKLPDEKAVIISNGI